MNRRRRLRARIGLQLERIPIVLVLFELLELFYVQKRVQIVLNVANLADVDRAVAVYHAVSVATPVVYGAVAVVYQAHAVARRVQVVDAAVAFAAVAAAIQLVLGSVQSVG